MGVTAIMRFENRGTRVITIKNTEHRDRDIVLSAGAAVDREVWIPWATNSQEFDDHHIDVEYENTHRYAIWQANRSDGDFVRISTRSGWEDPGDHISGYAEVDGRRTLIFWDDRHQLSKQPNTHGITNVIKLHNRSSGPLIVYDLENTAAKGHGATISAGADLEVEMAVPWARDPNEFSGHHLRLEIGGAARFWIWQAERGDGDYVRYSTDGAWHNPGDWVQNTPEVAGDRAIIVTDTAVEVVRAERPRPVQNSGTDEITLFRPDPNNKFHYVTDDHTHHGEPIRIKTVQNVSEDVHGVPNIRLNLQHTDETGATVGPVLLKPGEGVGDFAGMGFDGNWVARAYGSATRLPGIVSLLIAWERDPNAGSNRRVRFVKRQSIAGGRSELTAIGGVQPNGAHWELDIEQAIERIIAGQILYVDTELGRRIYLEVRKGKDGRKSLHTVGEDEVSSSLLRLPSHDS